ncbi:hypothetical protein [Vibrio phage VpV262]|uniref:Uncharacterized protein n=1 Tax=Vibrio phage VpV262 TaxID=2907796 RepID=Q8LT84_9CAUD|nr:hypothetical protein VpV262p16 [Vibrio phage VpV262]AAM28364.1 hypothetical protein [Vibrio phage VpV262]
MFDKDTVKEWNAHLMSHNADSVGLPFEERITWVMEWTLMWYMMEKFYGK